MSSAVITGFLTASLLAVSATIAAAGKETIIVQADEAWEDNSVEAVHFRGHFEIRGSDWSLIADRATLYGPLDDPDRIVAQGTPALVHFQQDGAGGKQPVEGQGRKIEYRRDADRIVIRGEARLRKNKNEMHSGLIEYDRKADTFKAGGNGGVRFSFTPESNAETK